MGTKKTATRRVAKPSAAAKRKRKPTPAPIAGSQPAPWAEDDGAALQRALRLVVPEGVVGIELHRTKGEAAAGFLRVMSEHMKLAAWSLSRSDRSERTKALVEVADILGAVEKAMSDETVRRVLLAAVRKLPPAGHSEPRANNWPGGGAWKQSRESLSAALQAAASGAGVNLELMARELAEVLKSPAAVVANQTISLSLRECRERVLAMLKKRQRAHETLSDLELIAVEALKAVGVGRKTARNIVHGTRDVREGRSDGIYKSTSKPKP